MREALLGIDIGTSTIKSSLFGIKGEELCTYTSQYGLKKQGGIIEIEPDVLWNAIVDSLLKINKFSSGKYEIISIGLCAMMIMPVFLDSNNNVIRPIIHWFDERLYAQFLEIKKEGKDKFISSCSGSGVTGESTINAIYWIKRNEPECYKKINKFIMIKDYIRFKLTGKIMTDFGDASGTLLLDTKKWRWSDEAISNLKIRKTIFPDLLKSTDIGGYITKETSKLTGLKEGTPVAMGSGDGITTILGLGIYKDGQAGIIVGSAGVIGAAATKFPKDDKYRSSVFCHPMSDRWYSFTTTASSGEIFRWYKNSIISNEKVSYKDLDLEAESSPPGTGGLIFLPYLLGSRNPHSNPKACGMILGLRYKHNRSYLTRAIMEGISFELLELLEVQKEISGQNLTKAKKAKISGGILNSKYWPQLLANVLQYNLITTKVKELGTLGSAIMAATASCVYEDLKIAINCMVNDKGIIQYNKSLREIYRKKYLIFKEIYKILEPKFDLLNE